CQESRAAARGTASAIAAQKLRHIARANELQLDACAEGAIERLAQAVQICLLVFGGIIKGEPGAVEAILCFDELHVAQVELRRLLATANKRAQFLLPPDLLHDQIARRRFALNWPQAAPLKNLLFRHVGNHLPKLPASLCICDDVIAGLDLFMSAQFKMV